MMKLPAQCAALLTFAGLAASTALVSSAQAQGMRAIYTFGPAPDGAQPNGGLVRDSVGRLYGVTALGGTYGNGTVYRLTHQPNNVWTEEILHSFNYADGNRPVGNVLINSDGAVFGVTNAGGTNGTGTVYRLDYSNGSWVLTGLHDFGVAGDSEDFNYPRAGLVAGPNGLLYATAEEAGPGGQGGIFAVNPTPMPNGYTIIKSLSGELGGDGYPISPLLVTDQGHLIGLARNEAVGTLGVAFDLYQAPQSDWREKVVYDFEGSQKDVALFAGDKVLVRFGSGSYVGCGFGGQYTKGVVYTLNAPLVKGLPWTKSILYNFGGYSGDANAEGLCGLTVAPDKSIYGTTGEGGDYGLGTIFHLTPPAAGQGAWQGTVLHSFAKGGQDGRLPTSGLLRVGYNYYGVSTSSNHNGPGDVFVIRP